MSIHKRPIRRTPLVMAQAAVQWIGSFDPFGPYAAEPARR